MHSAELKETRRLKLLFVQYSNHFPAITKCHVTRGQSLCYLCLSEIFRRWLQCSQILNLTKRWRASFHWQQIFSTLGFWYKILSRMLCVLDICYLITNHLRLFSKQIENFIDCHHQTRRYIDTVWKSLSASATSELHLMCDLNSTTF